MRGLFPIGFVSFYILSVSFASAEPNCYQLAEQQFPSVPSAPPQLKNRTNIVPYEGCKRAFQYRGKLLPIDSYYRKDAENLRPIVQKVPAALAQLNTYQSSRRSVELTAYTGTAGLVLIAMSFLLPDLIFSPSSQPTKEDQDRASATSDTVKRIGWMSGAAITGFSALSAFVVLVGNENRIKNSVDAYNQAIPEDRIELQFTTEGFF